MGNVGLGVAANVVLFSVLQERSIVPAQSPSGFAHALSMHNESSQPVGDERGIGPENAATAW